MKSLYEELQTLRSLIIKAAKEDNLTIRQLMAATWILGRHQNETFSTVLEELMEVDDTGLTPDDLHAFTRMLSATEGSHAVAPGFSLLTMRKMGFIYSFYDDNGVPRASADYIISPVDDAWAIPYTVNGINALMDEQGGEIGEE